MATRRELGLRRGVGLRALASILFVNLAMAVFVSLGVVADAALGLTPVVFVVVGFVFLLTLLGYVEGIAAMPQAGGAAGFTRRGLGELTSFFASWALILDLLLLVVLTAYFGVHYLGSIPGLGILLHPAIGAGAAAVLIALATLLTASDVRAGARTRTWVAFITIGAQVALAAAGLLLLLEPSVRSFNVELGTTPSWSNVVFALPIAMIGFTGLDSVAHLGAEVDSPGRDIPRPLAWASVTSVLIFVLMSIVALSAQPVLGSGDVARTMLGSEDGWVERPLIGIIDGLPITELAEMVLRSLFGLLAAGVLLLAASSALTGLGRIAWFMSSNRQAPSALFEIDPRHGVPRRAILLFGATSVVLLVATVSLRESAVVLAQLYAFGATLTAMLAGLAILRLRFTEPELERPFRAPGNVRVRGGSISIPVATGTLCSAALWCIVVATHDAARVVGITWMVVGFVCYGTYRLTHALPIARRVDTRFTPTIDIDMRSYRNLLLAVRPDAGVNEPDDTELIALADKLLDPMPVTADGRRVALMMVDELPLTEHLDAPREQAEVAAAGRTARLRSAASSLDLSLVTTVARARAAGRAICREAERRDIDAVLLVSRRRRRHADAVFGRTVTYVLRHARCDVVVLTLPKRTRTAGSASEE